MSLASFTRRDVLASAAFGAGAACAPWLARAAAPPARLKVAAIVTEFTYRSHAHVILENFLEPYLFNGERTEPNVELIGMYVDQFPQGDMARKIARKYGVSIYPTIAQAVNAGGADLAADGVLSIGEHGQYPTNAKGQVEYPRKRFFDEIVAAFDACARTAPIFNDKHLSFRWDWAKAMYDGARNRRIPFMAGSSVPLAERRPPLELPPECEFDAALSVHGGPAESYDFHGLEVLQSQLEFRRGGETGVARVQFLEGDSLWKAAEDGLWDAELAQAALDAELGADRRPLRERITAIGERDAEPGQSPTPPHLIAMQYRDGLKAAVLKVGNSARRWNFACRIKGEDKPRATAYHVGPWNNRNLFKALSHAIQEFFRVHESPYPIERTLLASGILDAAMDSRFAKGIPIETPHLDVAYAAKDFRALCESGASWKVLTESAPQPEGIHAFGKP